MRKVEFKQAEVTGVLDDDAASHELGKTRTGKFHQWGTELITEGEENHSITVAIIEEDGTGKIFKINPDYVKFLDAKPKTKFTSGL